LISDNVEGGNTEGAQEVGAQAYKQWICLELNNRTTDVTMVISNITLDWGKLYSDGNKDVEIPISKVVGTKIPPKGALKIYSCGRENASSGTEGTVTVRVEGGGTIGSVYWNCPWGATSNEAYAKNVGDSWIINVPQVSYDGAIGLLPVKILKDV
jgi:hypothetical protein